MHAQNIIQNSKGVARKITFPKHHIEEKSSLKLCKEKLLKIR